MIYFLKTEKLEIAVSTFGAELQSIQTKDFSHILWQKETAHWNRIAPILFPIVGRLKDDYYTYAGENYSMTQHGFARDQESELIEKTADSLRFRLCSNVETKQKYPFDFEFDTIYSINENSLKIEHVIRNLSSENLPFSVGGHPAFKLESDISDYVLEFDQKYTVEQSVLSNGFIKNETVELILEKEMALNYSLFENDAIVIKNPPFNQIGLKHLPSGKTVKMTCKNWTAIGIWTKKDAPFICIEPWWGWADEINSNGTILEKAGIQLLSPGKETSYSYSITADEI
ncbi:MAG: aldose 1-epimerase family protein [Fluviicola sp.]